MRWSAMMPRRVHRARPANSTPSLLQYLLPPAGTRTRTVSRTGDGGADRHGRNTPAERGPDPVVVLPGPASHSFSSCCDQRARSSTVEPESGTPRPGAMVVDTTTGSACSTGPGPVFSPRPGPHWPITATMTSRLLFAARAPPPWTQQVGRLDRIREPIIELAQLVVHPPHRSAVRDQRCIGLALQDSHRVDQGDRPEFRMPRQAGTFDLVALASRAPAPSSMRTVTWRPHSAAITA